MSETHFVFTGLAELKEALRTLPQDLTNEAVHIAESVANRAVSDIRSEYPRGKTGNLRGGVSSDPLRSRFGAGAIVKNTAKIGFIFEQGTVRRRTSKGWNRGSMPAGHVFVPVMMRDRVEFYGLLFDLLERHGLRVSGSVS